MKKMTKAFCAGLLALATCPPSAEAQTPDAAILTLDIANYVPYHYDAFDIQKFATAPVLTPFGGTGRAFDFFVFIGDIVAVNGKPAKGLWTARTTNFSFEPNAAPGHSTADVTRLNIIDMYWEILQVDGTPIGTLLASGLTRGSPPPGAPLAQTVDNLSIIGGTGAFLGATSPGIDPGQPFTADPLQVVNSPLDVTVSGKGATVLYAGGYPGAMNAYQVNFRVPDGVQPGMASIQLRAAWIPGSQVRIAVQ